MISLRILVVDDDEDIRHLLKATLENCGHTVFTAGNGLEALQFFEVNVPPDLIVLDLSMPVMDGRDFRIKTRRLPSYEHIPVILFSSEPDAEMVADQLGIDMCAKKCCAEISQVITNYAAKLGRRAN